MNFLKDIVKEQGVVNIIGDYKVQLENTRKMDIVLRDLVKNNKESYYGLYRRNGKMVDYNYERTESSKDSNQLCIFVIDKYVDRDISIIELNLGPTIKTNFFDDDYISIIYDEEIHSKNDDN